MPDTAFRSDGGIKNYVDGAESGEKGRCVDGMRFVVPTLPLAEPVREGELRWLLTIRKKKSCTAGWERSIKL